MEEAAAGGGAGAGDPALAEHELWRSWYLVRYGYGVCLDSRSDGWDLCYVVVSKGRNLFLYASSEDYQAHPEAPAYELKITPAHAVMPVSTKSYDIKGTSVVLDTFLVVENKLAGMFPWRVLKFASKDGGGDLEALRSAIHNCADS